MNAYCTTQLFTTVRTLRVWRGELIEGKFFILNGVQYDEDDVLVLQLIQVHTIPLRK